MEPLTSNCAVSCLMLKPLQPFKKTDDNKMLMTNTFIARIKPFRLIYGTDGTEEAVLAPALVLTPADTANVGFCFDYQERLM